MKPVDARRLVNRVAQEDSICIRRGGSQVERRLEIGDFGSATAEVRRDAIIGGEGRLRNGEGACDQRGGSDGDASDSGNQWSAHKRIVHLRGTAGNGATRHRWRLSDARVKVSERHRGEVLDVRGVAAKPRSTYKRP